MRCSVGQQWTGSTCEKKAAELNYPDAQNQVSSFNDSKQFGGHDTWRLPTITELMSLRKCSTGWENKKGASKKVKTTMVPDNNGGEHSVPYKCEASSSKPMIDKQIFPNTAGEFYLSSSKMLPAINNNDYIWGVDFFYSHSNIQSKKKTARVRLVRDAK